MKAFTTWLAALALMASCGFTRIIRDATYPTYVEVTYPDGSADATVWMCTREWSVDRNGQRRADRLECVDGGLFYETLTGRKHPRDQEL